MAYVVLRQIRKLEKVSEYASQLYREQYETCYVVCVQQTAL